MFREGWVVVQFVLFLRVIRNRNNESLTSMCLKKEKFSHKDEKRDLQIKSPEKRSFVEK